MNNKSIKDLPEMRVVAFIDILGFREIIRRIFEASDVRKFASLREVLTVIAQHASMTGKEPFEFPSAQATAFSDSIVISDIASDLGVVNVLARANLFIAWLLREGIFCRGAVAAGSTFHDNGIIIGEGIIKAYDLESQAAVYPRVILSEYVAEVAVDWKPELPGFALQQDNDGFYYIDIFNNLRKDPTSNDLSLARLLTPRPFDPNKFEKVRDQILQACKECLAEPDMFGGNLAKWRWLARRFNEAVDNYLGKKHKRLKISGWDVGRAG